MAKSQAKGWVGELNRRFVPMLGGGSKPAKRNNEDGRYSWNKEGGRE